MPSPELLAREITLVPTDELIPHPKNSNRGDVDAIGESVDAVGFYSVVFVQRSTNRILAGEHRWRTLAARSAPETPVVYLDVDDVAAERILVGDNEIPRRHSTPDDRALAALLAGLQDTPAGLVGTGYADDDLAGLLRDLTDATASPDRPDADVPLIPEHLRGIDTELAAPFPWFGGKRRVARAVWAALGECTNYVEPFAGSLAVLLGRPGGHAGRETVNDYDGFVSNFWRAVRAEPVAVAAAADWPVLEPDLHARAAILAERRVDLVARLEGDPHWFDPEIAGWWVWGVCASITEYPPPGPWERAEGELRKRPNVKSQGISRGRPNVKSQGISRELPNVKSQGISRELPNVVARGISRELPNVVARGIDDDALEDAPRVGITRQMLRCRDQNLNKGQPEDRGAWIREWFHELAYRLRDTVVCCGDWSRVTGDLVTLDSGPTGIFLDPPYSDPERSALYVVEDFEVAHAVRAWAIEAGEHPDRRIVVAGYEGEEPRMPDSWRCYAWSGGTPLGGRGKNASERRHRERLWFSPACLPFD